MIIPLLVILFFTTLFLVVSKSMQRKNEPYNPPPGPKGLPLVGNLHQLDGSKPHVYFTKLAKTYGPILGLRFGRVPVVVVQSARLAKEVLQTQDLNFCNRPPYVGMQKLSYNGLDIGFAPYNEYFREVKKISVVHLLSSKRVESFAPIGQEEVLRMITKVSSLSSASKIVNLSELLMSFACSNICRTAFGKRYENDEKSRSKFHNLLNEAQAFFITTFLSDYIPYGGWVDMLTGKLSRLDKTFKNLDAFYQEIINDHLHHNKPESEHEDIIDVLLHLRKKRSFQLSFDHIKAVMMNIVVAGTDTTAAMVVWAMTELVRNPNVMKKVQQELRNNNNNNNNNNVRSGNKNYYIEKSDLQNMKYFKAVVKETFRLHPASPLLIARESIRKTTIDGYDIMPNTLVYVNASAIGRDPKLWSEVEKFMPERFLETSIDFKGHDFELIPFGAGRRICPGIHLGVANMELALANLLYSFDWELPSTSQKDCTDDQFDLLPGITIHKKTPLYLVAMQTSSIYNFHAQA